MRPRTRRAARRPRAASMAEANQSVGSLVETLEANQAEVERRIEAGELAVRQKEAQLTERLAALEKRLSGEIGQAVGAERKAVRVAVEGVLDRVLKEEERRAALSSEHALALAEREWRGALLSVMTTADAELSGAISSLDARAENLLASFDEQLAGQLAALGPDATALDEKLSTVGEACANAERTTRELASQLTQRVEAQLEEHKTSQRSLTVAVTQALASAAEDHKAATTSADTLRAEVAEQLAAQSSDAAATHASCVRELSACDEALAKAASALAGALSGGGGGGSADDEAVAVEGSEDVEAWVARGAALERLREQAATLDGRCEALTGRWRREEQEGSARAERVEATLATLEPQVAMLSSELVRYKEECTRLSAELGVARGGSAAELQQTRSDAAAALQLARAESVATLKLARSESAAEVEVARAEARAETAAANSRADRAEARARQLDGSLALATKQVATLEAALADERKAGVHIGRRAAVKLAVGRALAAAQRAAAFDERNAAILEANAERDDARDAQAMAEASVLEHRRTIMAGNKRRQTEVARAEVARATAEAARSAAEAAQAAAEVKPFSSAHRLRAVTRYHPVTKRGAPRDDIDAALAGLMHACALPHRLTFERISRGWYWVAAANVAGRRPRRINLILNKEGMLMLRAAEGGVQTIHPVEFMLAFCEDEVEEENIENHLPRPSAIENGNGATSPTPEDDFSGGWLPGESPPLLPVGDRGGHASWLSTAQAPTSSLALECMKILQNSPTFEPPAEAPSPASRLVVVPPWQASKTAPRDVAIPSRIDEWQPLDAPTRSSAVHTFSNDQLRPTLGPLGLRIPVVDIDLSTE